MGIQSDRPLSAICCERDGDSDDQRRRLLSLLAEGADVNECDKNGVTPLHHAVRFRNPGLVELLLDSGADVNRACSRSGSTPVHRAVNATGAPGTAGKNKEQEQIIQLLLKAGADPMVRNKRGMSALDYVSNLRIRELLETS